MIDLLLQYGIIIHLYITIYCNMLSYKAFILLMYIKIGENIKKQLK